MTTTHASDTALPALTDPRTAPTRADRLLQAWTIAMIAFGLAIVLLPWVRDDLFGWIATGDADHAASFGGDAREYVRFFQAISGALTAGFGVSLWWLARIPIVRGERWAWWAFVTAVADWFVVDSVASAAFGYPRNVVSNLILVVPAIPLLWATRR